MDKAGAEVEAHQADLRRNDSTPAGRSVRLGTATVAVAVGFRGGKTHGTWRWSGMTQVVDMVGPRETCAFESTTRMRAPGYLL
jgi:hypothetical protein